MGKQHFDLPAHLGSVCSAVAIEIINAIPADWTLRKGTLTATPLFIGQKMALPFTSLRCADTVEITSSREQPSEAADVASMLIGNMPPADVEFGNASSFTDCSAPRPEERVVLACHFIGLGYRGALTFSPDELGDHFERSLSCRIFLPSDHPKNVPRLCVTVENHRKDPRWGDEIIDACHKFGFVLSVPEHA